MIFLFVFIGWLSLVAGQSTNPPAACSSIALVDAPPTYLITPADELFIPHIRVMKQYAPPSSVVNLTVQHEPGNRRCSSSSFILLYSLIFFFPFIYFFGYFMLTDRWCR